MVIKEYGDSELPKVVLLHPMLADEDIRYKTAVFDGTPMYENAKFIYQLMKFGFLKKHRKAVGMQPADVHRVMESKYGIFGECMAKNFVSISEKSLVAIVKACSDFSFPPIPEDMQKRIFLEVGSKDMNCRQNRVVLKHYPHLHIKVREGYGHCMYPATHHKEYGRLLEMYMNMEQV